MNWIKTDKDVLVNVDTGRIIELHTYDGGKWEISMMLETGRTIMEEIILASHESGGKPYETLIAISDHLGAMKL